MSGVLGYSYKNKDLLKLYFIGPLDAKLFQSNSLPFGELKPPNCHSTQSVYDLTIFWERSHSCKDHTIFALSVLPSGYMKQ
jgi:hypothetical protein